jgi:hypothetical protein
MPAPVPDRARALVSSLAPILMNECNVHGWDVAKPEGKPWTSPRTDGLRFARLFHSV